MNDDSPISEAWIDVGGTFTDCIVKVSRQDVRRGKFLSSGSVPITVDWLADDLASAPELANDSTGFWNGVLLVGLNENCGVVSQTRIEDSQLGGKLKFSENFRSASRDATVFELRSELQAPVLGVRRLLQIPFFRPLPFLKIKMGTTRGTNALLTRGGAKTALLVTDPFTDLLAIGDQTRPDLFALDIVKPPELAAMTRPISERLAFDGTVLRPLNLEQARRQLAEIKQAGCQSVAISLMHSYRNPEHERQLELLADEIGFQHVSSSSRVAPVIEYLARTQTTVVDAYLSPIVRQYLGSICEQLGGSDRVRLEIMTSAGGLVDWRDFSGKDCILSGPAGGVIALSELCNAVDNGPAIGLDMGGTSTDVCRVASGPSRIECEYESTKAGVRLLTPNLPIETVAAGGGSVCWFDGVSLRVGPQSAGAMPGPACYGRGGPLTITDLNVFSGRIPISQFPFPLDLPSIRKRIDEILREVQAAFGSWTPVDLVDGFRRLANEQMAEAVRSVSIRRGLDPRQHYLVGFGGAAGQHVCEIADRLGIRNILDHPDAGLLSALGMGFARPQRSSLVPVYLPVIEVDWIELLETAQHTLKALAEQLFATDSRNVELNTQLVAELRYQGTETALPIDFRGQTPETLSQEFHTEHSHRFGYSRASCTVELVTMRITVVSPEEPHIPSVSTSSRSMNLAPAASISSNSQFADYLAIPRQNLQPGSSFEGPAIVLNSGSTLTVESGWRAEVMNDGSLWLECHSSSSTVKAADSGSHADSTFDPVFRDCFAQRLSAIASQMGFVLQQTAFSVNVKRRRDFSCAIFDADGSLLANAPHVPVHLGAMGQTVRSIIARFPVMKEGDVFLCNDPYEGGSHLPDLSVVMPVFEPEESSPVLFVANRAHHADVGGIAPGSMSVMATKLGEEGMVIPPFQLISQGNSRLDILKKWAENLPFPPRNWHENERDLAAQQASCHRGALLLSEYARTIGWSTVRQYSHLLLEAGHQRVEQYITQVLSKKFRPDVSNGELKKTLRFQDSLEDGTPIAVAVSLLSNSRLQIDFTGTGQVSSSNFNANPSIVTAAILYVLRCLIADELPLNEGVLRSVKVLIPESVLNPTPAEPRELSPAVAAGNVETSQRVVDVLLGALGVASASQGTMNNLLFGNDQFGFYETICGGSGATPNCSGASAVHTHMTNTRLTDPEILEANYPVRLVDFRVRRGSGGTGSHAGGDGVIRTFEFLMPVTLSLITSRRKVGPFGLAGGMSGMPGENILIVPGGQPIHLDASCQRHVPAGSRLTIATPGGGGYGSAKIVS